MRCYVLLCENPADAQAATSALRSCDMIASAILNTVLDSRARAPMAVGGIQAFALIQVWTVMEAERFFELARQLELTFVYQVMREILLDPPEKQAGIKRMSMLERAAGLSTEDFRRIWRDTHGPRVASYAGALEGYCQNHVQTMSEEAPACDGLTELWFPDEVAMDDVLPSMPKNSESLTAHAGSFIGRISTFLLAEERIK